MGSIDDARAILVALMGAVATVRGLISSVAASPVLRLGELES
jgi:hypothetical protein